MIKEVFEIPRIRRKVRITFCDDAECVMPWSVQYGGGGKNFPTLREALRYAQGRGFIDEYAIEKVEAAIADNINTLFRAKPLQGDIT